MMFTCDMCGLCCRNLQLSPLYSELANIYQATSVPSIMNAPYFVELMSLTKNTSGMN